MDVVALVSGGKDSCYNMMQCVAEGHQIVALANLKPENKDELDSYMYQTVGHHAIELYAEAMGLPLFRRTIKGSSLEQGKDYVMNPQDEVEDLYQLLKTVKEETQATAVSVGAILSDYQRVRVEHVCMRLGLTPLAYLWRREQEELLREMIDCQVHAILIKVAALGLEPKKHLGKTLAEIYPHMQKMQSQYGLNMCGEGGEYETFTLDCPLFKKRIVMDQSRTVMHSDDAFAPVAYMNLESMHLEPKPDQDLSQQARIEGLPMTTSKTLMQDLGFTDPPSPTHHEDQPLCSCGQERLAGCPRVQVSSLGDTVYISGVYGLGDNVQDATREAFTQLKGALEDHDLTLADLAAVHLYVADMSLFHQINAVYKSNFSINPPIRVCVEVPLPENVVLQMDCVASRKPRSTMHVQGLSHWAPANIGPYSQAIMLESGHLHVAGQIAMTPADLSIITGGSTPQARLSLRHVTRVLGAMCAGIKDLELVVCYVTDPAYIQNVEVEWKNFCVGEPECSALVTYVIVPSLPKGAAVEWQVRTQVAAQEQEEDVVYAESREPVIKEETICEGLFCLRQHCLMKNEHVAASLVTISTNSHSTPKDVCGEKLLPDLLRVCENTEGQGAATLQVFFKGSCLQLKDLIAVYEKMEKTGSNGAVQFTPVLAFKDENCIITACY